MLSSSRTVHRLRVEVERGVSSCAPARGDVSSVVVCGCSIVSVVFACLVMERVRRRVMVISRGESEKAGYGDISVCVLWHMLCLL